SADGRRLAVPLDRLSEEDQNHVKKLKEDGKLATIVSIEAVESIASNLRTAKDAVAYIELLLKKSRIVDNDKKEAQQLLDAWKEKAANSLVRFDNSWLTESEVNAIWSKTRLDVKRAEQLFVNGNHEL